MLVLVWLLGDFYMGLFVLGIVGNVMLVRVVFGVVPNGGDGARSFGLLFI